jgi:cytochrome c-type biogenesis protein CcmH
MSATSAFFLAAGGLLLAVLAILLAPFLRRSATRLDIDRNEADLAIFRDELRELERCRAERLLDENDFEQARCELQRRLLEETRQAAATTARSPQTGSGRGAALALLVALPLAAAGGYALLGTPQALNPANTQAGAGDREMDILLQRLVARLQTEPDDLQSWLMLARSYRTLERFAESAEAFGHAEPLLDGQPLLLADYAEVLARANGGRFAGKPDALIAQALKNGPDEPQILFIAGVAASERGDFAAIADYWGRLLRQIDPDSDEARSLGASVEHARRMLDR